jgi:ADP-ribosylglycohydrolase
MNNRYTAAALAMTLAFGTAAFAQDTQTPQPSNPPAAQPANTTTDKNELKKQEKAAKAEAKADKQQRKAIEAREKADKAEGKSTSTPPPQPSTPPSTPPQH